MGSRKVDSRSVLVGHITMLFISLQICRFAKSNFSFVASD